VGAVSSVAGVWLTLVAGKVETVPVTVTALPTMTVGLLLVKTSMPSGVSGLESALESEAWMKKPFDRTAVTMPVVVTFCPT
jgi:hypothetical protein